MMELRPIVVGEDWKVLGGSMRLRALKQLGYTELPEAWVKQANELSESQKREFVLKDNAHFGTWDSDLLKGWGTQAELEGWGVELAWDNETPAETPAAPAPAETPATPAPAPATEIDLGGMAASHTIKLTLSEAEASAVRQYCSATGLSPEQIILRAAGYES